MPRGRKGATKPTMAKAKRRVARQKKQAATKNKDTYFMKAQLTCTIAPTQGVTVANYISWFPQLLNATSDIGVTQNSEFMFWAKVYDQVRVNSVHIRVVPKANVLDQANAQNDAAFRVTGDGLIHTCIDRDDKPPSNISALLRYHCVS